MKKGKLLLLTALSAIFMSSSVLALEFPLSVHASITQVAPTFQLVVDGVESESLTFDFGKVAINETVHSEKTIQIKKSGKFVDNFSYIMSQTAFEDARGRVQIVFNDVRSSKSQVTADFTAKAAGEFNYKDNLILDVRE